MTDPRYCSECGKPTSLPFLGRLFGSAERLCPMCAGKLCSELVRYFAGRKRDGLTTKPAPKNQMLPRRDVFGMARCRVCEMQLRGWKPGEVPYCKACAIVEPV